MKNKLRRFTAVFLAFLSALSIMPVEGYGAISADVPEEMCDNVFLDALAYTGYDVQAQINYGTLYKVCAGSTPKSVLSNISYGGNAPSATGLETTATWLLNIAYIEKRGRR